MFPYSRNNLLNHAISINFPFNWKAWQICMHKDFHAGVTIGAEFVNHLVGQQIWYSFAPPHTHTIKSWGLLLYCITYTQSHNKTIKNTNTPGIYNVCQLFPIFCISFCHYVSVFYLNIRFFLGISLHVWLVVTTYMTMAYKTLILHLFDLSLHWLA